MILMCCDTFYWYHVSRQWKNQSIIRKFHLYLQIKMQIFFKLTMRTYLVTKITIFKSKACSMWPYLSYFCSTLPVPPTCLHLKKITVVAYRKRRSSRELLCRELIHKWIYNIFFLFHSFVQRKPFFLLFHFHFEILVDRFWYRWWTN